jgi:hypothetical protein
MGDIEKAISSLEDAVQLTPDEHADKPSEFKCPFRGRLPVD